MSNTRKCPACKKTAMRKHYSSKNQIHAQYWWQCTKCGHVEKVKPAIAQHGLFLNWTRPRLRGETK